MPPDELLLQSTTRELREKLLPELHSIDPNSLREELLRELREELLLTPKQVADILNTSTDCLERLDARGKGPPRLKLGSRIHRYSMVGVRNWLRIINRDPSLLETDNEIDDAVRV